MPIQDVPLYPKGDLRRMLAVLAAIDTPDGSTLVRIVARTGIDKKTVTRMIEQAEQQAGVRLSKQGPTYRVVDWGPVIRRSGLQLVLSGELGDPVLALGRN